MTQLHFLPFDNCQKIFPGLSLHEMGRQQFIFRGVVSKIPFFDPPHLPPPPGMGLPPLFFIDFYRFWGSFFNIFYHFFFNQKSKNIGKKSRRAPEKTHNKYAKKCLFLAWKKWKKSINFWIGTWGITAEKLLKTLYSKKQLKKGSKINKK